MVCHKGPFSVHCFFLLYVNDIHKCSNKLWFYLFADDTNILYADKNVKALETTINIELGKFYVWLTANKLTLNTKKSNFIVFHPYQKQLISQKFACLTMYGRPNVAIFNLYNLYSNSIFHVQLFVQHSIIYSMFNFIQHLSFI